MNNIDSLSRLSVGLMLYADIFSSLAQKSNPDNKILSTISSTASEFLYSAAEDVDRMLENERQRSMCPASS